MVVFGSVVYKNALDYLDDFVSSINHQTDEAFDVLLINDDINVDELDRYICKIVSHKVTIIDETDNHKTPVELRVQLLLEAKKREYDLLILGDCDDQFDQDRVRKITKYHEHNKGFSFYYNDLLLFNGFKVMKSIPAFTNTIDDIVEYNYLGLSNTAINLTLMDSEWIKSLYECNSFVFDWYLYSRILIDGGKGVYVPGVYSLYRIYENNFAGVNDLSQEKTKKEYDVKIRHYRMLSSYSSKFGELLKKYENINVDSIGVNKSENSFWWSNIKLL